MGVGRVSPGTKLTLLPMSDRKFDNFNRECVLVSVSSGDYAVIGFVLIEDLAPVTE